MRIAMFTNNYKPYTGGVPISIEHLAQGLRKRGHLVWVFAPTYKEQEEEEFVIRYPSFPISVAKAPLPDVLTRLFEQKVKELNIELIHVHHPVIVGNVALSLKRKYGIPVVFTYHTRYEQYLHYIKPLEYVERRIGFVEKYLEYFCRKCDMVVAPTPGIREYLNSRNINTPIRVIPTGIPKKCFSPDKEKAEQLRNFYKGDADFLFCTVSRLAKEKNLIFQLKGIAQLKEKLDAQGMTFRHMMIGDGPQRKELEEWARRLGIWENLIFVGNVPNEDMENYQGAADLFLFTSKSETQGIVILEAMAAGNPVVALDATGVRDVVWHGSNGFLYKEIPKRENENADAWAEQIVRILENPEWYQQMSQAARETAEKYSQDAVAKIAEEYYRQICYGISQWPEVYGII